MRKLAAEEDSPENSSMALVCRTSIPPECNNNNSCRQTKTRRPRGNRCVYSPFTHEPGCYKLLCNQFKNPGLVLRGTGCEQGTFSFTARPPRARPTVRPAGGSWGHRSVDGSVRYLTSLLNYHRASIEYSLDNTGKHDSLLRQSLSV